MFSIFPCVCWPSVCLLWRNVFLCLLIYLFIYIELQEVSGYFGDSSFLHCFICKYFLPAWSLSFHLMISFAMQRFYFLFLFVCLIGSICLFLFSSVWKVDQKWSCWGLCQRVSACVFILRVLWCLALHLCI